MVLNQNNSELKTDVVSFTYSKKNHLEFFRNNNYDIELFNKKIVFKNCDLFFYQNLLIYSFIKQYVPVGSKILGIGKLNSDIFEKIKNNYECWEIKNINDLKNDSFSDIRGIHIKKYDKEEFLLNDFYNYFDFVFSISAFENIPFSESGTVYQNIIFNLNRLSKPGSYEIHSFPYCLVKGSIEVNSFLYYFFKDIYSVNKTLNSYSEFKSIAEEDDLYFTEGSSSDFQNLESTKKLSDTKKAFLSYNIIRKKIFLISKVTNSVISDYTIKTPVYVFHHIMKCGGTSMAIALAKWFNRVDEYIYDSGELNKFIKYKLNLDNLSSDTCIRGHYHDDGYFLHQRYPEVLLRKNEFKIFTFVRDPIELRISLYYYLKNSGIYYNNVSLETSLSTYNNFLASRFPCNESNYEKILERYFFFGIVEYMQESFDKLATITKKKKIKLPVVNTSEKDSKVSDLTPEFIKKFKEDNKFDYMIYDYCLKKFHNT